MSQRSYNRRKAKGFWAESQQVLLSPAALFEALPEQTESRTWLMAAFAILLLVAYSAVQQMPPAGSDFGASTTNPVQQQVITGLMAASRFVIAWIMQAVLLLLAAILSQGKSSFGLNLRLAIWASLPFAVLALIQIAYVWAGGPIGGAGLAPLFSSMLSYDMLDSPAAIFLLEAAQHITLFGFWNLALLYLAGQYSLRAKPIWIVLALLLWLLLLILVPAMTTLLTKPSPLY